jgi:hypothetical protein
VDISTNSPKRPKDGRFGVTSAIPQIRVFLLPDWSDQKKI